MTQYRAQYKHNQGSFPKPGYECVTLMFCLYRVVLSCWWNNTLQLDRLFLSLLCTTLNGPWLGLCWMAPTLEPWIRARVLICYHRCGHGSLFPPQTTASQYWYLSLICLCLLKRPMCCSNIILFIWGKFFSLTSGSTASSSQVQLD